MLMEAGRGLKAVAKQCFEEKCARLLDLKGGRFSSYHIENGKILGVTVEVFKQKAIRHGLKINVTETHFSIAR